MSIYFKNWYELRLFLLIVIEKAFSFLEKNFGTDYVRKHRFDYCLFAKFVFYFIRYSINIFV